LIAGAIGSLIAPWVVWGIEKKRGRLQYRREQIASWRKAISGDFDQKGFSESEIYPMLKRYLSKQLVKYIESIKDHQSMRVVSLTTSDPIRLLLLEDIAKLERKWRLI
jgi:hypothetical protein